MQVYALVLPKASFTMWSDCVIVFAVDAKAQLITLDQGFSQLHLHVHQGADLAATLSGFTDSCHRSLQHGAAE